MEELMELGSGALLPPGLRTGVGLCRLALVAFFMPVGSLRFLCVFDVPCAKPESVWRPVLSAVLLVEADQPPLSVKLL